MTIINHTYGFIFVHVPKNAGTSVSAYLSHLSTYRDQEIGSTPLGQAIAPLYRARFGISKHSTAKQIAAVVGPDTWRDYRSFAVTRDPLDRLASIFRFLRKWDRWRELDAFRRYASEFDRCRSLDEFVRTDLFRKTEGPDRIFRPQAFWLFDEQGRSLVDELIEIHDLERALPTFLRSRGVADDKLGVRLVEANKSPEAGVAALSRAAADQFLVRYAEDFERLGYSPAIETRSG
jgi:hypothetical protein